MDKTLVSKMLTSNNITLEDIKTFIHDYVVLMKEKEPSVEEIEKIFLLLNSGHFNLRFALKQAAFKLDLYVMEVWDIKSNILVITKTY